MLDMGFRVGVWFTSLVFAFVRLSLFVSRFEVFFYLSVCVVCAVVFVRFSSICCVCSCFLRMCLFVCVWVCLSCFLCVVKCVCLGYLFVVCLGVLCFF